MGKILSPKFGLQMQNQSWSCGATAARNALSCMGIDATQDQMIRECRTTVNGTDYIGQILGPLEARTGRDYSIRGIANDPPNQAQIDLLRNDIVNSIDQDMALVINIVAPPGNQPPGYPSWDTIWHYIICHGYHDNGTFRIFDSGFTGAYDLTLNKLGSLIPPKGYLAAAKSPVGEENWDGVWLQMMGSKS